MFELMKRDPMFNRNIRDLMNFVRNDPFFGMPTEGAWEDGNLALDVSEGDGEIIVRASLPGFKKDEIDVSVQNGVLTIKAEHTEEEETKKEKFYRKERRYGSVYRTMTLPGNVTDTNAKAELKDGVLTLHIPEEEKAKPKRIAVK